MKLLYFKGAHRNFGDDLNPWLWPKIFPNFFDEDERDVFVGIGSSIGADFMQDYGASSQKIIFGAGFVPAYNPTPNYKGVPDVHGKDWDIRFVRGPRTTRALNLAPELAVGDSAILIRDFVDYKNRKPEFISFMPHWESLERGNWEEVCRLAGVRLIDPRGTIDEVLRDLLSSKFVIAEAMHGAIVADALRVPWIPIVPMNKLHRYKWYDWAEALDIQLQPQKICPSSLLEARLSFMRGPITKSPFTGLIEKTLIRIAANRLARLAHNMPYLSTDSAMDRAHEKMLGHVEVLKKAESA